MKSPITFKHPTGSWTKYMSNGRDIVHLDMDAYFAFQNLQNFFSCRKPFHHQSPYHFGSLMSHSSNIYLCDGLCQVIYDKRVYVKVDDKMIEFKNPVGMKCL